MECFLVIALNKILELLRDDLFLHWVHMLSDVGNLNQQSTCKINGFQSLQINMHMEGNLTSEFFNFEFDRFLLKLHSSLSEQLTVSHMLADIYKTIMSLLDSTATEEGKTNLSNGSVVNDLIVNSLETDNSLDVSLK